MRTSLLLPAAIAATAVFFACHKTQQTAQHATRWDEVKRIETPSCALKALFGEPFRQPMACLAWEDGVYISRDGLTLYCDYVPCDLFSFFIDGIHLENYWMYQRGPDIGQDFTNPLGRPHPWIHGDVAMSTRTTKAQPFGPWRLSQMKGKVYNLGGVEAIRTPGKPGHYDYVVYTSDIKDGVKIKLMRDVGQELAGDAKGVYLPSNINDRRYHADNPHLERPDPNRPKSLVLFWDSDDRPGKGQHDIFYSLSDDDGCRWTEPRAVTSLNSPNEEEQPHLFQEHGRWWLYLTATNPIDHKLGIFRCPQTRPGDWDSWGTRELVVSAGTSAGVGEPTLTEDGDLSFVVVTINMLGATATDKYDCDPWLLKRKR